MAGFTLDTSGVVVIDLGPNSREVAVSFADLTPFTQGYIEALFKTDLHPPSSNAWNNANIFKDRTHYLSLYAGFSDLAPEALELILKDCEAFNAPVGDEWWSRHAGRMFWNSRNRGADGFLPAVNWPTGWPQVHADTLHAAAEGFPPLTAYLGDDGKVHLREAA